MKAINKVILIGNLGRDPEMRYTPNGTAVANFSIATTERVKSGEEYKDHTEWHNIVAWRRLAEIAGEYLKKGSRVYIEGKLRTRSWDDKTTGKKVYKTEIQADDMMMLDGRNDNTFEPDQISDDDIPF